MIDDTLALVYVFLVRMLHFCVVGFLSSRISLLVGTSRLDRAFGLYNYTTAVYI